MKIAIAIICTLLFACNSANNKETSEINSRTQSPELKQSFKRGKIIYNNFCMTCHMPNGKGVSKTFPPLKSSDYLMNNRIKSIKAIKFGLSGELVVNGETYNTPMARLGLSDTEIADVMNFITNSWGNKNASIVTEKEVSKIKP